MFAESSADTSRDELAEFLIRFKSLRQRINRNRSAFHELELRVLATLSTSVAGGKELKRRIKRQRRDKLRRACGDT